MPKKIIAVLLSALVIVTAFVFPVSAAEDAVPSESSSIQYATNLIPYPYVSSSKTINGVTFTVLPDGGVSVVGTAVAGTLFQLTGNMTLKTGVEYTVSGGFYGDDSSSPVVVNVRKFDSSGADTRWIEAGLSGSMTGVLNDGESIVYVGVYISSGATVNATVYPMLNVGDFASPYMLYLPYLLDQQYNNGYASGEAAGDKVGYDRGFLEGTSAGIIQGTEQGYKDGYQAAVDAFSADNLNPFSVASLVGQVYLPSDPTIVYEMEIHPSLTADGAISVNACIDLIKNRFTTGIYEGNDLTDAKYVLHFSWLNQSASVGAFDCETSLFAYRGTVGVVDPYMLTGNYWGFLNGSEYHPSSGLNSSISAGVFLFDIGTVEGFTLSDFRLRYKDTSANRSADLYIYPVRSIKSPQYNVGYLQGFLEGQKSSLEDAGQVFYDQGYNVGFTNGKKEGLSIAETGDWRNLMLAVTEAPINTFQSLFNFQVLGMDMRAAFGSILALCVVLIIVKKAVGL